MAKIATFPPIIDFTPYISISGLKKWASFEPNTRSEGHYNLENGAGSVYIFLSMGEFPYMELTYSYRGRSTRDALKLVSIPSNLNLGKVWYFQCPITGKRCRKLYSVGDRFGHLSLLDGMYEQQTYSKKYREMWATYGWELDIGKLRDQMSQPGFKKYYKGKPTKRYLRIQKKIDEIELRASMEMEARMKELDKEREQLEKFINGFPEWNF
ncbi:hypothetical protein [Echinicola rosea]|uniref:Uncharacterized protein n=1 Tax=Echinicola rosea TaxID=1807691 RepID=A0ABQ1V1A1_9BACT|nr:hypothetical protein [Echinicola rosea]GGF34448.1 hypothetical protein GCM10011339_23390 [Echinicola rosea]